jgi:hypothetical protein
MADKVWTAEELGRMTPADQDSIFKASLVDDLASVPPEFLERVRNRTRHG